MNLKPHALVPVLSIFASILIILFLDLSEKIAFNPPYLLLVLNLVFWTTATLAISLISAKSFLKEDSSVVLINSCSIIIFGLPVIISGWAQTFSINKSIALSNPCILVASILQVLSAILAFQGKQETKTSNRKRLLSITYLASVIFVLANTAVALLGYYPPFFAASGPTLLRQVVLGSSVFFFGVAAIVFGVQYLKSKSPSLYWYALAIGLFSVGLFSAFEQKAIGDVPTWLGRSALYVGTLYLTAAIFASKQKAGTDLAGKWAEAFRSNPKQIADFFSNMIEGFVYCRIVTDASGKPIDYVYLDANGAAEHFVGVKRENLIGKRGTEVFPEISKDPAKWIGIYGNVALTGAATSIERYSPVVDKWYHASIYSPQKGYFVAIFEDTTERKKAEESLRNTERLLTAVTNGSSDAIYVKDFQSRWLFINPALEHITGKPSSELLGKNDLEIYSNPETGKAMMANDRRIMDSGKAETIEETVEASDGVLHHFISEKVPRFDDKGQVIGLIGISRDITERKKMEIELEEYSKNLEKLVEERTKQLKDSERLATIGATAGMVGHDIRNPLQAITSDVYLAKTELASTPESDEKNNALESLQEIEKNIDYINKIVQDLQDFARPLNPKVEESDLKLLVESLIAKNGLPKNVRVKINVAENTRKIMADSYYLNRILSNLVTNAVQAMPQGGKLTIEAHKETNDTVITITDTGVGIPKNIQDKMFTLMFTTKAKGQGFGLPVVNRMAESLGGTVSFESQEGKGTTFTIRLPLRNNQ